MPRLRSLFLLLASACAGTGLIPAPENARTTAFAIPATSGGGLAFVYEPDLVSIGNGGIGTEVAGASVAVGVIGRDVGQVAATFGTGATSVLLGPTSAWVLQSQATSWTLPLGGPAPNPFVEVTRVDRTSLARTGSRAFLQPLQNPSLLSDRVIVDALPSSSSDVARAVYLHAYDLEGPSAPTPLVSDLGFAAAACFASGGAVLAYEPTSAVGTVSVVGAALSAGSWTVSRMSVPGYRLDPTAIACSDDAGRALLSVIAAADGESHALLVDVATKAVIVDGAGLQGPLALRGDGGAALALATASQGLTFLDASKPSQQVAVDAPGVVALQQPWQAGDLTLWSFGSAGETLAVVSLADGSIGATVTSAVPLVSPWPAGPGFVVADLNDMGPGDVPLAKLRVLRAGGVTTLPLGKVRANASLAAIDGDTLYTLTVAATDLDSDAAPPSTGSVQVYDLATGTLTDTVPLPLCDAATVDAKKGCLP